MYMRSNEVAICSNVKEACVAWKNLDWRELRAIAPAFDEYGLNVIGYRLRQVADDIEFILGQGESEADARNYAKPSWRSFNRDLELFLD